MPDAEYQRRTAAFIQWFKQQPSTAINPKIEIADLRTRGAGRGIIALEDIDESEELFSVPHSTVLNTCNSELHHYIPEELASLDPWLSLVLVMIYEFSQGQASRWWPYLEILPTKFDTLMYWTRSELAELQGSAVVTKIGREEADKVFVETLLPLVIKHGGLFGEFAVQLRTADPQGFFLGLAHRMATLIMAYGFDLEKVNRPEDVDEDGFLSDDEDEPPKGMVPLADLLNAEAERNNARLFYGEQRLIMSAVKQISKGDEILNEFGPLPRSDLLRRYGYITDSYKKWDVVELDSNKILGIISSKGELGALEIGDRVELAQQWEVWEESFDLTRQTGDENQSHHGFDPAFAITLKVLTINEAGFKEMEGKRNAAESSMDLAALSLLHEVVRKRQQEYSSTIAEDVKLLQDKMIQGRQRMAIEIRLGEKEILAATLQYTEQRAECLSFESTTSSHAKEELNSNRHISKRRKI
ncbi:MAG: hypothetical protein Q9187_000138 [Circinaria calcarea]